MKCIVDEAGRALVTLSVLSTTGATHSVDAWVDTAFDGELVMPTAQIRALKLSQSASVEAGLADGTTVLLDTFHCAIDWFGEKRDIEVIANEGRLPLLGLGLLRDRRLRIDWPARQMTLE